MVAGALLGSSSVQQLPGGLWEPNLPEAMSSALQNCCRDGVAEACFPVLHDGNYFIDPAVSPLLLC